MVERRFDVTGGDGVVPGILWTPDGPPARGRSCCWATAAPATSGRRTSSRWPAASSATRGYAVAAIDGPGHGDRADAPPTDDERPERGHPPSRS